MNSRLTKIGASILILAFLLPIIFLLISMVDMEFIKGLFIGLDWFCCFGTSGLLLIFGLLTLLIGIRTD